MPTATFIDQCFSCNHVSWYFFPTRTAKSKNNRSKKQNLTSLSRHSVSSHAERTGQHQKPQHGRTCSTVQLQQLRLLSLFCVAPPALSPLWFLYPPSTAPSLAYIPVLSPKTPLQTTVSTRPGSGDGSLIAQHTTPTHIIHVSASVLHQKDSMVCWLVFR